MARPRGHSNCYPNQTEPYPTNPDMACVPIAGGSHVWSVRPLPPLCIDKEDWEEIGRRMGWTAAGNILQRLTEKVERANAIQHSGGRVKAEDWSELYDLANEAKAILAKGV